MTWEPGMPVHPHPRERVYEYPEIFQPMVCLKSDQHPDACGVCDGWVGPRPGLVWSLLFKEAVA